MQAVAPNKENIRAIYLKLFALIQSEGFKCEFCDAAMIIQRGEVTIVKCMLLKFDKETGAVEIKCRECGRTQTAIFNNK